MRADSPDDDGPPVRHDGVEGGVDAALNDGGGGNVGLEGGACLMVGLRPDREAVRRGEHGHDHVCGRVLSLDGRYRGRLHLLESDPSHQIAQRPPREVVDVFDAELLERRIRSRAESLDVRNLDVHPALRCKQAAHVPERVPEVANVLEHGAEQHEFGRTGLWRWRRERSGEDAQAVERRCAARAEAGEGSRPRRSSKPGFGQGMQ